MKKSIFFIGVVFLLTQTVYLGVIEPSQGEHVQSVRLAFTKDVAPLADKAQPIAEDSTAKQHLDLDKINSVGDKSLEYFEQVETSLMCLEEQLARLTVETKNLRQHIERLKFVIKNQVPVEKKVESSGAMPRVETASVDSGRDEKVKEIFIKSEDIKREEMKKEKEEDRVIGELVE